MAVTTAENRGTLYLFPSLLADTAPDRVLPAYNIELISGIKHFVVEELRTARRFLKACNRDIDIDSLSFEVLNEHTAPEEVERMLQPALEGFDIGVVSEAGCPAVADPGADIVAAAQSAGVRVVPLVGPSSIMLSLMASGFNGQQFTFLGYLPIDGAARAAAFRDMERDIRRHRRTQIFIETPYRNDRLFDDICRSLPDSFRFCVAAGLTGSNESVTTRTLAQWRRNPVKFGKVPAIFLLFE